MRCSRPIELSFRGASRESLNVHGKSVTYYTRSSFLVPCGKCFACKSRRKSQFVFRMDSERRHGHLLQDGSVCRYRYCFFVTLSYAPFMLPRFVPTCLDPRTGEVLDYVEARQDENGILNPWHFKEFMKRLRRYYDLDCKVFACGEYGDDFDRPHMHLILFSDLNWKQTVEACRHAWSFKCPLEWRNRPGSFLVDGKYRTWRFSFGRVDVKAVNMRRIRYVAKYIIKDTSSNRTVPTFARVSNGLGSAWLLTSEARAVRSNKRLFAYTVDGKKASLGRYFTHRLFRKDELQDAVDAYIDEFESPPPGSEFGEPYRRWFNEHIVQNNVLYRQALARSVIPRLCSFN